MSLLLIIILIWIHFIADFVLQTDWMAINKSTQIKPLAVHCLVYTIPFLIIDWQVGLFNGIMHFIIDFISSKITTYYYLKKDRHKFLTTIGLDQAIHLTILFYSITFINQLT